ncbi:hypothetical protein KCV87_07570 [Actinosynnema pretiosum subsp. pretiosum]|uniref:N-acetyltransferase domain-containing protein n=1 Tax=Actinosynnema pretiosum subsp. pretiosum TaxID=103721 RepID=A0AA45LAU7_9PSEU|nr:putative acetyltransferase [Actinosynnema pretiosum subsp. pretiosum]QUF05920.1 hypothetical protein KCV87_07570 [Actinosynnema pretiosum subsp. pretiosum]
MIGTTVEATGLDAGELGAVLAEALHDSPLAEHYEPDGARRREVLELKFGAVVADWLTEPALPAVRAWLTPCRSAAAVWTHADYRPEPVEELETARWVADQIGPFGAARYERAVALAEEREPEVPHHRLRALATVPHRRRSGLASVVLEPGLRWCDEGLVPAYLWTAGDEVLPFYRMHGFDVLWTQPVAGGLRLHGLWREPVAGGVVEGRIPRSRGRSPES